MLNVGGAELLIILLLALVVLGPERLPGVARQIGQTVSSLRSMASSFQAEMEAAATPDADPFHGQMRLPGPTEQSEAIAMTQTDPAVLAAAARQVTHDDEDAEISDGGPTDLRDEEE